MINTANRRMFAAEVIQSDDFLDLTIEAQALYFHLGIVADDDGFLKSARRMCKLIGAVEEAIDELVAGGFIYTFPSGVVVIRHWKQNNYLQNDRYHETVHQTEKAALIEKDRVYYLHGSDEHIADTESIQNVSPNRIVSENRLNSSNSINQDSTEQSENRVQGKERDDFCPDMNQAQPVPDHLERLKEILRRGNPDS